MGDSMTRIDVYNEDYVSLNHSYIQMYKFYNRLLECGDADDEVLSVMREILLVFNPTLDRIKSEMTVKTRYKDEKIASGGESDPTPASSMILHGNFTGE